MALVVFWMLKERLNLVPRLTHSGGGKKRDLGSESHDILSHFCEVQNYLQIDLSLEITVHQGTKTPKKFKKRLLNKSKLDKDG